MKYEQHRPEIIITPIQADRITSVSHTDSVLLAD